MELLFILGATILDPFKSFVDGIMNTGIGVAGLLAGYRIFQAFNRGEDVTTDIIRWVGGLFLGYATYQLAGFFLFTVEYDNIGYLDGGVFNSLANDIWIYGIYIGGLITVIGFIRVYSKFAKGDDDIYEFSLRWFGSIVFLFSIGWVVFLIKGYVW